MSVGLLMTKNGVPCGAHARRSKMGLDVRMNTKLRSEGREQGVQYLTLSKKTVRQLALDGKSTLTRIQSCPDSSLATSSSVPSVQSLVGVKGSADQDHFAPVWDTSVCQELPRGPASFTVSRRVEDRHGQSFDLSKSIASMQEAVAGECLEDLPRSSKWGFVRKPDGSFWMK
eukprot:TRINITY_DN75586_c0_g1_i1.p1 TRINITY_DN75586_c0_g1~~TRINITY_DN75586_c0_g1_i1.p1  ORF type:complete len:186 (-),score=30.04 TRINITY_DN75586_c0_g1_i1:17-532(-)